jgi:hypothetical protein
MGHSLPALFDVLTKPTKNELQQQFQYEMKATEYLVIKDYLTQNGLSHMFVEDMRTALDNSADAFETLSLYP